MAPNINKLSNSKRKLTTNEFHRKRSRRFVTEQEEETHAYKSTAKTSHQRSKHQQIRIQK